MEKPMQQLELHSASPIDQIRAKAQWARAQEESARERLLQAERLRAFWVALADQITSDFPASILLTLRTESGYLKSLRDADDPIYATIEKLRDDVQLRAQERAANFAREFPGAARKAGLEIDSTSRHPRYSFKQGFIQLDTSEKDLTAILRPRDGETTLLGLDVELVVQKVASEIVRIFDRPFHPESFVRSLYTAYVAVLRAEKRPDGDEVPLRRVTSRLAKNLNRFAGDEFNVDLVRLLRSGQLTPDGRKLQLNHSRNSRQGMLLHGYEQGGYMGFISFKKEV